MNTPTISPQHKRRLQAHFGFTRLPFRKNMAAADMFDSRSQRELLAGLLMWTELGGIALVVGKETDPEITFVGTALAESAGADMAGKKLSHAAADTLLSRGLSYYGQVLAKRVPITFGGDFKDQRGVKILYRSIILPLPDDGTTINRLLAAVLEWD